MTARLVIAVAAIAALLAGCEGGSDSSNTTSESHAPTLNENEAADVSIDLGYGPDLFYTLRHDPLDNDFSTFGTIAVDGTVTDRFGVGPSFDALTFVAEDLGYGPNRFYFLRHDAGGFTTFGTISVDGTVTDRFGVGLRFDALTFVAEDLGYGANLFYHLHHDVDGFSTFGTISTDGTVTDRFGVGQSFDALTFVAADVGYGTNLFYYLRHDPTAGDFSTFGTISVDGTVTDRFGVGPSFDALVFATQDLGYGADLFYFLRHDPGGFSTFGTISVDGTVTDRFGVGSNFDALIFTVP